MRFKTLSINDTALFPEINQWDRRFSQNQCTIYGSAINLKYNCWINLTEDDLDIIANRMVDDWKLRLDSGARGEDGVNYTYDYVREFAQDRWWKIPNLVIFKDYDLEKINEWLQRGYMLMLGIRVNREFVKDARDGKIEKYEDYKNYQWKDLAHFTNVCIWKCRFSSEECEWFNKEMIVDSYAFNKKDREWIYECDIKELLEDIAMNTKYIFF